MTRRFGLPDEQQALVLDALRRAAGSPVSFSELRDAGIEFPASIVSELELAGVAIERCRGVGGRGASVRLVVAPDPVTAPPPTSTIRPKQPTTAARLDRRVGDPARRRARAAPNPPHDPPAPPDRDWTTVRTYRASTRETLLLTLAGSKRLLAPIVLLAALAVVAAVLVTSIGAGGTPVRTHAARRTYPRTVIAASRPHARTQTRTQTQTQTAPTATATTTTQATPSATVPPTPVSLALATQLEAQGHDLLASGNYAGAIPVLRRALAATGERVGACLEPQSTMCLTYAYALYDLGRALRLAGDPAAAVPILERRLQIDNQRPTVLAELALARAGAT
jgi:hypothetical protein